MGLELKCSLVTLCLLVGACGEAKNDFFDDSAGANGTTQNSTPSAAGNETSVTGSTFDSTGAGGSDVGGSDVGGSVSQSTAGGSDVGGSASQSTVGASDVGGSASQSTAGASTSESNAATTAAETATSDTTSSGGAATSTTGASNDPECPERVPEATTFCNEMIGLSCTYDEVTCTCSGLTWNCMGGETTSTGTGNGMGPGFGGNGANGFGTGGTFND